MAARSLLDLIIRTRKEGTGAKDARSATKGLQDDVKKLRTSFLAVTGAAVAAGIALKKAFDLGRQGAVVTQTRESFALLLEKIGAAPDLLSKLETASLGTVSQMELMSSTATLLAGASGELAPALAAATPELLEIAKAANKLNPSLGDTTFLYESLARGIKRASPLILDNLGLVIKIGEANERFASSLGKSVSELTANEQKMALLNETVAAGRVLIQQAGGEIEAATDTYDQFTAKAKNATDALKAQIDEALQPMIQLILDWADAQKAVEFQTDRNKFTLEDFGRILIDLVGPSEELQEQWRQQGDEMRNLAERYREGAQWGQFYSGVADAIAGSSAGIAESSSAAAEETRGIVGALREVTEAQIAKQGLDALNEAYQDGDIDAQTYREGVSKLGRDILGLPASVIQGQLALADLEAKWESGEHDIRAYIDALNELDNRLKGMGFGGTPLPEETGLQQFQFGGQVPGPLGLPRLILAHGGEEVVPAHQVTNTRNFFSGGTVNIQNGMQGRVFDEMIRDWLGGG